MKFIHLSDLHLGKRVNEFSMIEDQEYILKKILGVIADEKPDGILIAGDVYDKAIPSAEAIEMFDDFLVSLAKRKIEVFIISGNHDSAERLAFGNRLMDTSGIHFSPAYSGKIEPFFLEDAHGSVGVYMLPFIKPAHVRQFYPDEEIATYTDAVRVAVEQMHIDSKQRNILITHQFVTGAQRSDSEELSVGGMDNVDASVFDGIDYVALGHIHGPQNIGSERIRYCGTPLKYSFSEVNHKKSVTVIELLEKGSLQVRTIPLESKRDMVELKGTYEELMLRSFYENTTYPEDYVHVILTDEDDVPDAISRLRSVYRNIMKLDYDNKRTRHVAHIGTSGEAERKSPLTLFEELYTKQNGVEMVEEQKAFMLQLIEEIWEDK